MRINPIPMMAVFLLSSIILKAQVDSGYTLYFNSGSLTPIKNITAEKIHSFNQTVARGVTTYFGVIQFEKIPSIAERNQLLQSGIVLLDYIPNNAYTVSISGTLDENLLRTVNARSIIDLSPAQKMQPDLAKGLFPGHAVKVAGSIDLWISFPKSFTANFVIEELRSKNISILSTTYRQYRILSVRIPMIRLNEIASFPFIDYVQPIPNEDKILNVNSMSASRANNLKAPLSVGGKNLTGSGVVVGVGDNGDIQSHLDFSNRLINRTGAIMAAHATHVSGTIAGAGIIKELYEGYAPKATILSQYYSGIFSNAEAYVQDYGMVITNNSFGTVTTDCYYNGLYDLTSRILDQQAIDFPELQQVFAAGNDGSLTCSPYPAGFKTVLGGYQSAKNVLVVGSTDYKSTISAFSSRGPVRDGRLKPEIMSQGEFVASTWTNNLYSYNNGTSMAAPGVSGGSALLVERYRQLHGGANPKNGLMKALLCNGATDKGNAGPDFKYGFGRMDLVRSLAMMEAASYVNSTVANSITNTHTITVPANTAQLKVLVYWQDPAASVLAAHTLVNDIDLEIIDPSLVTRLPSILDTLPANVNNPASGGVDHINNMEQVVINNPVAGTYDIKIKGTAITQNPSQEYFLVYDMIPVGLVLTNPVGSEKMIPAVSALDTCYVQWDDYTGSAADFTLEFSSDNGSNWTTLSTTIPSVNRVYNWGVPNIPTEQARIRISKNSTAFTQTSSPFTITAMSTVTLDAVQCEGYIKINWTAVPGATDYEVMLLQGNEMQPVATTTGLTYTFSGLSKNTLYWVTVRPRINGIAGRRAFAISRMPNNGTCAGTISDNDIKIDSILSPVATGRVFTSTALTNSVPVTIRIKNLDNAVSTADINVSYTINGGTAVNEVITSPASTLSAGGTINYTFSVPANLAAVGVYTIKAYVKKASDLVAMNDTVQKEIKQLANQPITNAELPWQDDLETLPAQTISIDQSGFSGNDRYDFYNSTLYGQAKTFINTGIAFSGDKAITLDQNRYVSGGNVDSLTATFNLATFDAASDDVRIDFRYKNHGQKNNAANKVWLRGSDTDSWIEVYNLYANQNEPDGSFKLSTSIELSDSLAAHGQNYSASTQLRWGQWGEYLAADNYSSAGYTFDDIRIYKAVNDIQLLSIDTPFHVSCGLNTAVPVKVSVRNTSNTAINNIPIVLKVDGAIIATENIVSIGGSSTIQYTFNPAVADLSVYGEHTISVWVALASDNFKENDTSNVTINHLPLVTSFPYLQNFENDNGYWYADGIRNSWEYGTPVSPKINRAASGSKAWKTNIAGYYNDAETSYLYSPCFNLSGMTNPSLSFSMAMDIEDCGGSLCDAAWVEYSTDGGLQWFKLGTMGTGTNWYNKDYAGEELWSKQDNTHWHVASTSLPTSNNSQLRIRFVFQSDSGLDKDGLAIDDVHIYDNVYGIYEGITMASPVAQTINPGINNWVDFLEAGKLIASIQPAGQQMGVTNARTYINTGSVRLDSDQYYLDRNITIQPEDAFLALADSVWVRYYFLDSESEALINASGCSYCYKPSTAYDLGISKYSDPDNNFENGTVVDNNQGVWTFINPANVSIVPFDKGYYAEFKVNNFSEFWLNNGGFDNNQPLPLHLVSFTARKVNSKDVTVEWITSSETDIDRYEIEVSKGNDAYQQTQFNKIGELLSQGNSLGEQRYHFIDLENNKSGVRYYRLKIVESNGTISFSAVRPVVFGNTFSWQISPNPSTGLFHLNFQADTGEKIVASLYDLNGRIVKSTESIATGFIQKLSMDISSASYVQGIYLLVINASGKNISFKLVKQ